MYGRAMVTRLVALSGAVLLIGAAPAAARSSIEYSFHQDGNPWLVASSEAVVVEWRACPPTGAACHAIERNDRPDDFLSTAPGETPAGTVFEAVFDEGGTISTQRTPAWQGTVRATATPVLTGEASPGGTVRVGDASWTGAGDTPARRASSCCSHVRTRLRQGAGCSVRARPC